MSGQSHGYDNTVVIGKETTYGTLATGFKWPGIVESFEPEENNNIDSRMSVGVRAPLMLRQGAKEVDGNLTVALQNARLIGYALGKVATSGDGTAGYTHTITPTGKGEGLPSFSVQNYNALLSLTRNYIGGKVDSLTITAEAEEAVSMEAEILFSHIEKGTGTPANVIAELENYYMFYEGSVKINNATVSNITEFELEVNNNLERRFTIKPQNRPDRIEEGNLEITSSMTMDFTSITHLDSFLNGDNVTAELNFQDVANPNHSLKITLTGGLYDTNTIEVSAEDLQEQELEAIFTGITVVAKDSNSNLLG
jgi:Phage tail tube protein